MQIKSEYTGITYGLMDIDPDYTDVEFVERDVNWVQLNLGFTDGKALTIDNTDDKNGDGCMFNYCKAIVYYLAGLNVVGAAECLELMETKPPEFWGLTESEINMWDEDGSLIDDEI